MMSCKVKCPESFSRTSEEFTFMSTVPRKESLPSQSMFLRRRKVCVDCVLVFCVSVGIMSDTQHAVVSCDYIQTYYSWSNCVYTVFQFFTVWQE